MRKRERERKISLYIIHNYILSIELIEEEKKKS